MQHSIILSAAHCLMLAATGSFRTATMNCFLPFLTWSFGVSDYWTCSFAELGGTPGGNFRLSFYLRFQCSCLQGDCGWLMSCCLGAVVFHLLRRADVAGCTVVASSCSGCWRIWNTAKTGFYLQRSACRYRRGPFQMTVSDFFLAFAVAEGAILFQLRMTFSGCIVCKDRSYWMDFSFLQLSCR